MAYRMPACFDSWKQWYECLKGVNRCPDHEDGNAIISRIVSPACDLRMPADSEHGLACPTCYYRATARAAAIRKATEGSGK